MTIKGIVQPLKRGSWMVSIDRSYNPLPFRNFVKLFFKDPDPLNSIKCFSAIKQLKLGQVSNFDHVASAAEISIAVCPKFDFQQYRYAPHRGRSCVGLGHKYRCGFLN